MLTNRQVKTLCKDFGNNTSTYIKLSTTRLSKMIQLGRSITKTRTTINEKCKSTISLNVLIPLRLTTRALAADARIHKKILGSGHNTTVITSNDEMKDILKIVKSLENCGLILEGVSETIKNEAK